jgi:micrococcal nuclease
LVIVIPMTKKELIKIINIAILLAAVLAYFGMRCLPHQKSVTVPENNLFYVSRVIDGDTIKLSGGEHVRLIGIDAPESRYNKKLVRDSKRSSKDMDTIIAMGKKATDFVKDLVQGRTVKLEFDVEKHDKYGRLLAYIYLEDGTFVNARIMEEGYAQVMTIPPNVKYADQFLKLQKEAREKNKGLWQGNAGKELF